MKVLSVDDNKIIRVIVASTLRAYDCTFLEAENGQEGLAIAAREKPDLIILDVMMPVMDGMTMLGKMKDDPALNHIPVLMLTAESGRKKVLQIAQLGNRDYLAKPFSKEQLLEKMKRIIPLQLKNAATPAPPPAAVAPAPAPPSVKEQVAQQFGLQPIQPTVQRLAKLVQSQESYLEEIGALITQDPILTARLLRAANTNITHPGEYEITTVEQVLMRHGTTSALFLAMGDPLRQAISTSFQKMLSLSIEVLDTARAQPFTGEHVLGEVGFTGKADGFIHLRLNSTAARMVAAHLLGLEVSDPMVTSEMDTGLREMLNIIGGNFKSNLCDAGLDCSLCFPQIRRTSQMGLLMVRGSLSERMAFRAADFDLFVDVTVNPWQN